MTAPTLQSLGRYILHAELGKGGFATVYRALDTTLEREVALKVLKPGWTDDAKAVERFMREAKQASRLKHPNIVTIFDVGQAEGRLFIAMELVPGRSLQRIVSEDGPLPWPRALAILEQTAAALDYAHKQGLVHRDIKPANIILDESESSDQVHVVLTDFGLVRGAEQASLSVGSTGGIIGTPEYISPEIWDGQPATTASDVYALGCVAYYLLTGQILFGATTPVAVLKRHIDGPAFPQQWPDGVPDGVIHVLRQTLNKSPDQRQATAIEFVVGLRACGTVIAKAEAATVSVTKPNNKPLPARDAAQPSAAHISTVSKQSPARRIRPMGWLAIGLGGLLAILLLALVFRGLNAALPIALTSVPAKIAEAPLTGLITYIEQNDAGAKRLFALDSHYTPITLTQWYSDVRILAVSPSRDYLAAAVSANGNISDTYPYFLFVGADTPSLNVMVVSTKGLGAKQLLGSTVSGVYAAYTAQGALIVAALSNPETEPTVVTYYTFTADGSNQRNLYESRNSKEVVAATPPPAAPKITATP